MGLGFTKSSEPLKAYLSEQLARALTKILPRGEPATLSTETSLESLLARPPQRSMGDYAFPCFAYAKILRIGPPQVAQLLKTELLTRLETSIVAQLEVVGGFLNFFVAGESLARLTLIAIADHSLFAVLKNNSEAAASGKVMLEFSQPNTHKEFHIGHARNVCLGDALTRIFAYNGYEVMPVNYIGDEGTHVAKCLWQLKQSKEAKPSSGFGKWYGSFYARASHRLEQASSTEKITIQREIAEILSNLESQKGSDYELWQQSRADCMQDFTEIYAQLGVKFAHIFYESEVSQESQSIVDEYIAKGLFVESQGAWGINLESSGLGFFMARKSDGTSLYITKDLALARRKFKDFAIARSIYVVGNEQNFHFRQLFKVLALMGFPQAAQCHHVSYAHVKLVEGKISSRGGTIVTYRQLYQLLDQELARPMEKYREQWSPAEIAKVRHQLVISAIKYGMLASDPQKEIVFDPEAWTSFEGSSGPYLLYCYARAQSILRKGASAVGELDYARLLHPLEVELLWMMYDFNEVVAQACSLYKPSLLSQHLFVLGKAFNRFYAELSVLAAPEESTRYHRLALVKAFAQVMHRGLDLLGIEPAERM